MKRTQLLQYVFLLWCGWVLIEAPIVEDRTGINFDASRPVVEWEVATFGGRMRFFDSNPM